MTFSLVVMIEVLRAVAGLVLISTGLMIIFGMMRVINIAHGEFLMLGGYTVVMAGKAGVNPWIAMLVLAPIVVGLFGVLVERLFIRFFYGRRSRPIWCCAIPNSGSSPAVLCRTPVWRRR
jgi:branched-subunit amino acid ABC-type transport system permease component